MEQNNFILDLIASLKKTQSQKQIKEDIKNLGDFKLPLIGTLSKSKTKAQLKQDLSSLNGTVNLTGKVDNKGITTSVYQATQQAQKAVDSKPLEVAFSVKKEKLLNDIKLLAQQNSKLFKDNDMSIKYNSLLDSAEMARNSVELSTLRTQLGSLRSELKITGNAGMTMTDALKNGLSKVLRLFGSTGVIMQFTAQLRNAWTEAKELDKSMTDLSRVNAAITRDGFPDYLDRVISKTKQLAVATKDYIDSVTTFSRAGYNLTDSEALADMAVQLEKVGDMDSVSASKALLAGLQGYIEIDDYGMDQLAEKAQALNDKIDIIGNTASISQKEVAEGIQAVGSVMSDANTSVDEFIALLGAGNRAVQDSDKVALAIRTSALRIRGCTAELQEMGEETDNVIESTSTLAEKIKALTNINGSGGVNILEADEETFRSIYDIYNDIAKVYDKMSDKDASALLDLIAGKNRSNQISAILQNMSEANELLERSLNAAGTASAEYEIYLNSAQAASERFSVAMTETYSNILNGETVKGLTNAGTAVLEFANSWNILEGTIKGFLALGILKGVTTLTVAFKNSAVQISNYGNALDAVKQIGVHAQETVKYANAMDTLKTSCVNLTDAQLKQVLANRNLSESQLIEILQLDTLEEEQAQARLAQLGLIQTTETQTVAQGAATASTFSLSAAVKGLGASIKAAWMTNKIGISIMAISTVIGVATSLISKYNQQLEETRQKNIEAATTAAENADKIKNLYNEYTRLASIQDRTTSEEEAFKTAVENIVVALGDKTKALENLTAGTDEYAAALERVTKEELQSQAVTATIGRKSAEEELQGEIWSDWKGSKVSIDSNSKGKSLSSEAQKAVAIVSDSLKEYETVNRKWGNISWDISSDDPTEALEFYNSLVEAREKLVSASGDDEALLDTEIYEDLNTAINTMSESLDTYIEKLYAEEKLNYMAQNGIPSVTEEYKTMESALVSAAGSCVDLQDRFKELLTADFTSLATSIEEVGDAVSDMTEQMRSVSPTLSISDTIDQLNTQLKPAFDSLKSAWQDIFTDDGFALNSIDILSTCDSIKSKLDELNKIDDITVDYSAFEDFVRVLNNSESEANDVKDAFNDLATSIAQAGISGAEDFETMKAALEDLGVVNEELVAFDALISNTEALKEAGLDLANATDEQIAAFANEIVSAENVSQAIAMLTFQKELCGLQDMNTAGEVANLLTLAENAGYTGEVIEQLTELEQIYQQVASGTLTPGQLDAKLARAAELETAIKESASNIKYEPKVDFSGATKSAKSAGKEASDAYVEAFEKELKELETLRDQGKISEKEYLDALKALYQKFFKDKKKYAEEYAKYERQYLDGMKSLYDSALSGISKLMDSKIDSYTESKEAAIESLKAEQQAAEEAYQSQIDAIDDKIKALEKEKKANQDIIDGLNDEIDKIREANEERNRQLTLQEKQIQLERMQHQRTILQYSEDKGMHYVQDTEGIRKAKNELSDAEDEIKIADIEKQIKVYEDLNDKIDDTIDNLNEQKDAIQDMIDASNKYYDTLIKEQEQYWDSMIKNLEQQKSRWEELAEVKEIAEAFSYIQQVFGDLGYTVEDVLNGSDAAFEDFKSRYISLISDMNSNSDFTDGLVYATGIAKENLGSFLDKTKETGAGIDELASKGSELGTVAEGMDGLATSASDANTNISETATSVGDVASNVGELSSNLTEVNSLVSEEQTAFENLKTKIDEVIEAITQKTEAIQEEQEAVGIATSSEMADFLLLKEKILEVKETLESLGTQDEGLINSIALAIESLNEISLEDGIIGQFTQLKEAVDAVASTIIGGGESSGGESQGGGSGSSGGESRGKGLQGEGGSGNSLTGAIEQMGETANEVIGEPNAEGDGTVIGEFGSMETAVNDVRDAIGTEGSDGEGGNSGGESDDTLVGSIEYLGDKTEEEMGESGGDGIIGRFEEFRDVIGDAEEHVQGINHGLDDIDGKEVECTIKVNIETTGGLPAFAEGTLGNMNLESGEYTAKYGKAFAEGTGKYKGLPHAEKNALVSEYGQTEMTVLPDGNTIITDEPTMMDLPKDTVIYNEEQTKKIMDNKVDAKVVKSYANGTVEYSDGTIITPDGNVLRPLREGDRGWELMKAFEPLVAKIQKGEEIFSNAMFEHQKQMEKWTKEITNNTAISNITNNNKNIQQPVNNIFNITMPNVTNSTSAEELMNDLQSISRKKYQVDW